jgi:hypothetical protein
MSVFGKKIVGFIWRGVLGPLRDARPDPRRALNSCLRKRTRGGHEAGHPSAGRQNNGGLGGEALPGFSAAGDFFGLLINYRGLISFCGRFEK